jgi:cystathionine beta-synthase
LLTIGETPLVRLNRLPKEQGIKANIFVKCESFNPGGSIKDRIALSMIDDAERKGLVGRGQVIVEPTSGNTGIGLAMVAAVRGYRLVCVVLDKVSREKVDILKALGAFTVEVPSAVAPQDPRSYYNVSECLAKLMTLAGGPPSIQDVSRAVNMVQSMVNEGKLEELSRLVLSQVDYSEAAFIPRQHFNEANVAAHYASTGPEIWRQTEGKVDVVVAGMGTGGTITGVARYLKERNLRVLVVGVDPEGSLLHAKFSGTPAQVHGYKLEGIGEDFIPGTLDLNLVDRVEVITDREAFMAARELARTEGILAGGSGGAALHAAMKVARKLDEGKTVVVILPDTGRNYLNKLYSDDWMRENGYL